MKTVVVSANTYGMFLHYIHAKQAVPIIFIRNAGPTLSHQSSPESTLRLQDFPARKVYAYSAACTQLRGLSCSYGHCRCIVGLMDLEREKDM